MISAALRMPSPWGKGKLSSCLHDISTDEANHDHERPAGHQREPIQHVANRLREPERRQPAVKGLKRAFVNGHVLVRLLRVDAHYVLDRRGRGPERQDAHSRRGARLIAGRNG